MRNIISYLFLILLLLLFGISYASTDCIHFITLHCVAEISQDYRSPNNGYCDGTNSKEELVEVWWSSVGIQITSNDWDSIIIPDIEHSAQFINNPSLSLQDPPFVYADDATPWTNGENWSDTWAVCAVFETTGFHGNSAIGPSVINNLEDINTWDTATRNSVPESTWRIVGVADINVGLTSFYGWTKPMSRLCLIEK